MTIPLEPMMPKRPQESGKQPFRGLPVILITVIVLGLALFIFLQRADEEVPSEATERTYTQEDRAKKVDAIQFTNFRYTATTSREDVIDRVKNDPKKQYTDSERNDVIEALKDRE